MGVETTTFVIAGADLGYGFGDGENEFYEKYERYVANEKKGEFTIVADGMCGTYLYAGIVIAALDGGDVVEIDKYDFADITENAASKIKEILGVDTDTKVFAFIHYS